MLPRVPEAEGEFLHLSWVATVANFPMCLQSQVVDLVRQNVGAVTLAIGDGANDVPMIQAAQIGESTGLR